MAVNLLSFDSNVDGVVTSQELQDALEYEQKKLDRIKIATHLEEYQKEVYLGASEETIHFLKKTIENVRPQGSIKYFRGCDIENDGTPTAGICDLEKIPKDDRWFLISSGGEDGITTIPEACEDLLHVSPDALKEFKASVQELPTGIKYVEVDFPSSATNKFGAPNAALTSYLMPIINYDKLRTPENDRFRKQAGMEELVGDGTYECRLNGIKVSPFKAFLAVQQEVVLGGDHDFENATDEEKNEFKSTLFRKGVVLLEVGGTFLCGGGPIGRMTVYNTMTGTRQNIPVNGTGKESAIDACIGALKKFYQ